MDFKSEFKNLTLEEVHEDAEKRHEDGWRYVQMLAVNKDDGVDLLYSYMLDGTLENLVVDVPREQHVPSITDIFLEAFVCENEIHDLFGVPFDGLAIDFLGNFYRVSEECPMTIISPAQLAEREKQAKIAAAKAAKEAKEKGEASAEAVPSEEKKAKELEAKLAAMDPEKAAKVRAAMEAQAKKQAESKGE